MKVDVKTAYKKWLSTKLFENGLNITFTLKQVVEGVKIDNVVLEKNFRYFKNMLNKKVFGNAYKRFGKQLKMLVVREVSALHRLHLHTIIELPNHILRERFIHLIRLCWSKTRFGYGEMYIEQPTNFEMEVGWFNYIMKNRSKIDFGDSIDLENSSCLYVR